MSTEQEFPPAYLAALRQLAATFRSAREEKGYPVGVPMTAVFTITPEDIAALEHAAEALS